MEHFRTHFTFYNSQHLVYIRVQQYVKEKRKKVLKAVFDFDWVGDKKYKKEDSELVDHIYIGIKVETTQVHVNVRL